MKRQSTTAKLTCQHVQTVARWIACNPGSGVIVRWKGLELGIIGVSEDCTELTTDDGIVIEWKAETPKMTIPKATLEQITLPVVRQFIRPVYCRNRLLSIALCRTNRPICIDADVLDHFPPNARGADVRDSAVEFHGADEVQWGFTIDVPDANISRLTSDYVRQTFDQ